MKTKAQPDKTRTAQIKVLCELGKSHREIARLLGRSQHTVATYLNLYQEVSEPVLREIIEVIRNTEINDLELLSVKAGATLHGRYIGAEQFRPPTPCHCRWDP
jgi:transposase